MENILNQFVTLFVVIDPIGTIPVFLAATKRLSTANTIRCAGKAIVLSGGILLFFLLVGQILFTRIGVSLDAFKVAGGIVLFLFGLKMIFDAPEGEGVTPEAGHDVAVFPVAVPSIAGPGGILSVVVMTNNDTYSVSEQALTASVLLAVLGVTYLCLLQAAKIQKVIGVTGAHVVSRVMGLILCAVASESVIEGIRSLEF